MENQSKHSTADQQAALLAVCRRHGWSASFLDSPSNSSQQLAQLCMKEMAACRAAGRGDLAVILADAATAAGLAHPRLASHRERARGQQEGGALVQQNHNNASALASPAPPPRRSRSFWHWLPGFRGKGGHAKRNKKAMAGSPEQIEALVAICRSAGWTPNMLGGDSAIQNLPQALLREMRTCSEAGEHRLVVRLGRQAASLGIKHPRLTRARRQAQALLESTLLGQLEAAIQLREQGQAAASLALLDAALNQGHQSPWIQDNRARALVDLGRRADAIALWEKLQGHADPAVVESAQQMLQLQRQQLLLPLHDTLHQLADQHAWPLRHLGDPNNLDLQAYTTSLIKDAIEARDGDQPDLSLAMLEAALAAGLPNPWLHDNRARALVHLHRLPEAVALWQELCQHPNDDLRSTAQEMVERFGAQARRQLVLAEAAQLEQAGEQQRAISVLTEALLCDPQCLEIQSQLQTLLIQRDGGLTSGDDDSIQELEPHRRGLLAFTEVLNALEQRLQGEQH